MKFIRIFVIVLMAFTMCAVVSLEDVRESEAVYNSIGMLKASKHELSGHYKQEIAEPVSHIFKSKPAVSAEVTAPSATTLSLATCVLRC